MIAAKRIFENFYDDEEITTTRLYSHADDCLNKLINANGGGTTYTALITLLTPKVAAVATELSDVDTSVNIRVGKTQTVDEFIANFKNTMSTKEGVIADALGGFHTPAFMEFYPHGVTEYRSASKTLLPTLLARVNTAATAHAAALGATLTATLQGFEAAYNTIRDSQLQQKGSVDDNRVEKSEARAALELAMLQTVHTIAAMSPGDVMQCLSFFDFNLLTPHDPHPKKKELV